MFIFPVQLTTSRIGNLTRLIHTLLYVMTIHTYIHQKKIPSNNYYRSLYKELLGYLFHIYIFNYTGTIVPLRISHRGDYYLRGGADTVDAIRSLANGKAVGPDGVSVKLLKITLNGDPALRRRLLDIVVRIWRGGEVPQQWKDAIIMVLVSDRVRQLQGHLGLRGGIRKRVDRVCPRRPQSFRHQRRPVDDCSPGRGGMAQDGGTFHGEMDRCSVSQGWITGCSRMPERDRKDPRRG